MAQEIAEDKNERFRRLAEKRTNKIIDTLKLLGNCANRGNYTYTAEEVARIFAAIEKNVADTKKKFAEVPEERAERFHL